MLDIMGALDGLIPPHLRSQSHVPAVPRGMTQTTAQRSRKEKRSILGRWAARRQVPIACLPTPDCLPQLPKTAPLRPVPVCHSYDLQQLT